VPEEPRDRTLQPPADIISSAMDGPPSCLDSDSPPVPRSSNIASIRTRVRPEIDRTFESTQTGSSSSDVLDSRRGGRGERERDRTNRYSFSRPQGPFDDEEYPFLFDMSELGRNSEQSRRSIEETRGGVSGGNEKEPGGGSRRGSHRGW
jgi:hypothetical protein